MNLLSITNIDIPLIVNVDFFTVRLPFNNILACIKEKLYKHTALMVSHTTKKNTL